MNKEQLTELRLKHTKEEINPRTKKKEPVVVMGWDYLQELHGYGSIKKETTEAQKERNTKRREEKESNEIVQAYMYLDKKDKEIIVMCPLRLLEQTLEKGKDKKGFKNLND